MMNFFQLLLCSSFVSDAVYATKTDNYDSLYGVAFSNTTDTNSVKTDSASLCAFSCSVSSCNAAQYSYSNGLCSMTFGCAWNTLHSDTSKLTIIKSNYFTVSGLPMPMFEWMMTDACGSTNTGWSNTGLIMHQTNAGTSTWTATYNISVGDSFGNAIWYPNMPNYCSLTSRITLTIDFSKSLTLFAYYWLYAVPIRFCLIEFAQSSSTYASASNGPHFWYDNGGLFSNFNFAGCNDCINIYNSYQLVTKVWTHAALVYNSTSKLFTAYLNGSQVGRSTKVSTFTSTYIANFILTGARGSIGQFSGSTYCLKIFQSALTASSIMDVANSCKLPTVNYL